MTPRDRTAGGRFRILAIANETVEGDALHRLIADHAGGMPADALAVFPADQLIISTHPERKSNWLARDVVRRARERFGMPTAHVVAAERELVAA